MALIILKNFAVRHAV